MGLTDEWIFYGFSMDFLLEIQVPDRISRANSWVPRFPELSQGVALQCMVKRNPLNPRSMDQTSQ